MKNKVLRFPEELPSPEEIGRRRAQADEDLRNLFRGLRDTAPQEFAELREELRAASVEMALKHS